MYGMYTDAGDAAVSETIGEAMEKTSLTVNSDAWEIVQEISALVIKKGQGQVNPSKYNDDDDDEIDEKGQGENEHNIVGFDEVTDSVVRDRIYDVIDEEIQCLKQQAKEDAEFERDYIEKVELERDIRIQKYNNNNKEEEGDENDDDDEDENDEEYEGYEDDEDDIGQLNNDEEYEPEMEGEEIDSQKRNREEYGDWADFGKPAKSSKK